MGHKRPNFEFQRPKLDSQSLKIYSQPDSCAENKRREAQHIILRDKWATRGLISNSRGPNSTPRYLSYFRNFPSFRTVVFFSFSATIYFKNVAFRTTILNKFQCKNVLLNFPFLTTTKVDHILPQESGPSGQSTNCLPVYFRRLELDTLIADFGWEQIFGLQESIMAFWELFSLGIPSSQN